MRRLFSFTGLVMHDDGDIEAMIRRMGLNDPRRAAYARDIAEQYLARESFLDFAHRVYPGFQAPRHIVFLAGLLEKVERGEIKRLCISAPPGHGKSSALQIFLAWFLGRNPRRRILALSASERLAQRNSRVTRGIVQSDAWPWKDIQLVGNSIEQWYTNKEGGVRAIGRTGVLSGYRAELALLDDVQSDVGSETTRASDVAWFNEELATRLEPDGAIVLIQTRWIDSDLPGYLRDGEAAGQWTFVNLPAIAEENDSLGRIAGEALWPERWPIELLEQKKAEIGSSAFSALYQGDPVPSGGAMFQTSWLEGRYDTLPAACVSTKPYEAQVRDLQYATLYGLRSPSAVIPLIRVQAIDAAAKTGLNNDRTAVATVVTDLKDFYIENVAIARVDYPGLRRLVVEQFERYRPNAVYIEQASNGQAVIDDLRSSTSLPIVPLKASDSKEARASAVTGLFEAGKVKFRSTHEPWLAEVLAEFARFPHGKHDDALDAIVWALLTAQQAVLRAASQSRHQSQVAGLRRSGWMSR